MRFAGGEPIQNAADIVGHVGRRRNRFGAPPWHAVSTARRPDLRARGIGCETLPRAVFGEKRCTRSMFGSSSYSAIVSTSRSVRPTLGRQVKTADSRYRAPVTSPLSVARRNLPCACRWLAPRWLRDAHLMATGQSRTAIGKLCSADEISSSSGLAGRAASYTTSKEVPTRSF
jgi:hypothetical protein